MHWLESRHTCTFLSRFIFRRIFEHYITHDEITNFNERLTRSHWWKLRMLSTGWYRRMFAKYYFEPFSFSPRTFTEAPQVHNIYFLLSVLRRKNKPGCTEQIRYNEFIGDSDVHSSGVSTNFPLHWCSKAGNYSGCNFGCNPSYNLWLYILDKTQFILQPLSDSQEKYFLTRPRRFGKTLFLRLL